ncbi:N-terminal nucleophile aminohydrolase [Trichocladium antarcticum]|uniref:N-terminal nucleophile aminohydrolase n=1 Tax=Trichocladium antarcticum TaxID=1450529 RepID=A0AAN6ZES7_9PEZI|nr:N-terminal nucleophile aminohydrolase [Trichocladium antarcticum]
MEYQRQPPPGPKLQPRLIIHGGAGNITPSSLTPARYREYRTALLTIISKSHAFMTTPNPSPSPTPSPLPNAPTVATHAVTLLENSPLFNAAHGAVFTRDGTHELEASIMVSRGAAKRAAAVSGLRRVRNPVTLAAAVLQRGDTDLAPRPAAGVSDPGLDVPSAQGHTHLHGAAAEQLAVVYGLPLVAPGYFFTRRRWDEHVRGLARERERRGGVSASWSGDEYLPQGTCGAVAVDGDGVVCCATSTGGLTNKLSGRIGDTPAVGAGFWAEEWCEEGGGDLTRATRGDGPAVVLSGALRGLVADCLPTPWVYSPLLGGSGGGLVTTRSVAVSGTGNGDSFLRTAAARTVGSIARFAGQSSAVALRKVSGPGGELQKSAGDRWGKTGEGEGGMIGIECVVVRDLEGTVVEAHSELLQDYNCGGMFRAWVDDNGVAFARVFGDDQAVPAEYVGEGEPEDLRAWYGEKLG